MSGGHELEFLILGPVEVSNGAGVLRLGGPKQRALLADLVLNAGTIVSTARLIEDLWGNDPPPTAGHTVEAYISRIRRVLQDGSARQVLLTKPPGYLLDVGRDRVDAFRFEELVEKATAAAGRGDDGMAAAVLRDALGLWRGDALADVSEAPFALTAARRLADRRLLARERRIEADLRLGHAQDLVAELEALAAAHPYHEPFHQQLMLALYRSGRQTDALAAFRRARVLLVDELGIEPRPELRQLEQAILRQDPELQQRPAAGARLRSEGHPPPRALPGSAQPPRRAARRATRRRRALVAAGLALAVAGTGVLVALQHSASGAYVPAPDTHANAVVFVDPTRTAVLGQADTHGRPAGIAAGFGRLWVADTAAGRVLVLDPATFSIEDKIPVGRDPTGVAAGADGIWVTDPGSGTVSEINPGSETVVATVTAAPAPSSIAAGAGAVWVADAGNGTLTRIDPGRASVVDVIDIGQPLADVAVGLGSVWVTSASSGQLIGIDSRTGQVTQAIPVGNGPASVRVVGGAVWVANPPDGTVSRFDPATGDLRKVAVPDPTGLAGAAGALWVASGAPARLTRVDPATGTITGATALANPPAAMVDAGHALALVTQATPEAHRGGTLNVVAGVVYSIDPGAAWSPNDWQLLSMTNDGLLTYARNSYPGSTSVVPDLATTLPLVGDGGRSFTFRLRSGVRYSNGIAVRPEDFRRALERQYQAGSGLAALGVPVVGSERCGPHHAPCRLDSGVAVDDAAQTVTYHLSAPDPAFLYQLALPFGAAVPSGTPGIGLGNTPLPATGPYLIASYSPGRQVLLVRNPRFRPWSVTAQPAGFPARISVRLGLQPDAEAAAVTAGRADVMLDTPPAEALASLRRRVPQLMHTYALGLTYAMFLNTRIAPFNRISARQALDLAVDRSQIARLAGGLELARPTCQILPPGFPGYYPYCVSTINPDPAGLWRGAALPQARALVAASGTSGETVTVSTVAQDPFKLAVGRYFVGLLDALGYRARLRTYPDFLSYYRQVGLASTGSQLGVVGWAGDYPAGSAFFGPLFSCASYQPRQPYNTNPAGFCDREIDSQIAGATALETVNVATANRAWQRVDREIMQQVPWIPLVNPLGIDLVSERVGNYQRTPAFGVLLDQLWIENQRAA
jgi:ABC-type transport system substrate-binding protein/DNA-binding SARP family transcriptional activator